MRLSLDEQSLSKDQSHKWDVGVNNIGDLKVADWQIQLAGWCHLDYVRTESNK